jgi:hypothetical protein
MNGDGDVLFGSGGGGVDNGVLDFATGGVDFDFGNFPDNGDTFDFTQFLTGGDDDEIEGGMIGL